VRQAVTVDCDAAIVGGGPAGCAAARVLAAKNHRVVVLTRSIETVHGRAESLPPSTRRVLARIGALPSIDAAGFYRTTGNSIWWGERKGDVETFGVPEDAGGYQVSRPALDALLRREAAAAGASVLEGLHVDRVQIDPDGVRLACSDERGRAIGVRARMVLDASGRAGVVARGWRRHQAGFSSQAYVGAWTSARGWQLPEPTHTVVETYDDGWAYSVPLSATARHIGVIVDGARSGVSPEPNLVRKYLGEIAKTRVAASLTTEGTLERAWACAASMYDSIRYAEGRCLLVGDAGSFLEPLSSFGVKKALVSGWMGAVCAHTALVHPDRGDDAFEFFSRVERRIYVSSLERSCEYAREAYARHPGPFWAARAATEVPAVDRGIDDRTLLREPDVLAAFERLKACEHASFMPGPAADRSRAAFIRGDEVVVDEGIAIAGRDEPVRFVADVDLVELRNLACSAGTLPELLGQYQRRFGDVSIPALLGSLSLLVARGILIVRSEASRAATELSVGG
jgi:flavin-dependent dehydrogenase